jgi:hypothetical protein
MPLAAGGAQDVARADGRPAFQGVCPIADGAQVFDICVELAAFLRDDRCSAVSAAPDRPYSVDDGSGGTSDTRTCPPRAPVDALSGWPLLAAQCDQRVEAGRAPCRQIARQKAYEAEHERPAGECRRVDGGHAE